MFPILQLIECGKVSVKDVALDIGVSPDSLAATLAVMHEITKLLDLVLASENSSSFKITFLLPCYLFLIVL